MQPIRKHMLLVYLIISISQSNNSYCLVNLIMISDKYVLYLGRYRVIVFSSNLHFQIICIFKKM